MERDVPCILHVMQLAYCSCSEHAPGLADLYYLDSLLNLPIPSSCTFRALPDGRSTFLDINSKREFDDRQLGLSSLACQCRPFGRLVIPHGSVKATMVAWRPQHSHCLPGSVLSVVFFLFLLLSFCHQCCFDFASQSDTGSRFAFAAIFQFQATPG